MTSLMRVYMPYHSFILFTLLGVAFFPALCLGQQLQKVEYFIDTDPGVNQANHIAISGTDTTDLAINIPTVNLTPGLHTASFRTITDSNTVSLTESIYFVKSTIDAGQVQRLEYFIDTDPGFGQGIPISVQTSDTSGLAFSINTTALTSGLHSLHVRALDMDGNYSQTESFSFIKFNASAGSLVEGEYFFDTDPGHGNGLDFSLHQAVDTTVVLGISLPNLSPGLHHIFIRTKNQNGWSMNYTFPFVKVRTKNLAFKRGEYFIDTDPGVGSGVAFGQNSTNPSGITFSINTSDLTIGAHTLYIRVLDSCGHWSITQHINFFRVFLENNLQSLEWFIDVDPGHGQGTSIALSGTDSSGIMIQPDVSLLPAGLHILHVRAKSENGSWSVTQSHPFIKVDTRADSIISGEYFFDENVAFGEGIAFDYTVSPSATKVLNIDLTDLDNGLHYLYYRSKSQHGTWSITTATPFVKYPDQSVSLAKLEYFVNDDPGFNQGGQIALSGTDEDSLNVNVDVSTIPFGFHKLYVRAFDSNGSWSQTNQVGFVKYCQDSIVLINVYVNDTTYHSAAVIQSNGTMNPEATVFRSQEIDLLPGFTVPLGVQFIAENGTCPTDPQAREVQQDTDQNASMSTSPTNSTQEE